jgi:chromosome segregation ATPase
MNRSTEADFLAVGEKLMGFLSTAREIRADISRLADSISGEAGQHACDALTDVLDGSTRMQEQVEQATHTLGGIRHAADKIQRGFSRFDDIVLSFHVVATLGRIETARLGGSQSDLSHLADEVRSCSEKIRERVETALREAAGLDQRIDLTIQKISGLDTRQLEDLPCLAAAVRKSLEAFRQRQQQANETSASLANEFKSFSEAINGVVTALQFHDITRQQIEHAVEALSHLAGNGDSQGRALRPSADEVAVIELQRQQLLGAAKAFASSVEQVKRELEQIASRGREMAGEAETLLCLAGGQQSSFFDQMERCFAGVLAAVSNSAALNEETANATAELQRYGASPWESAAWL